MVREGGTGEELVFYNSSQGSRMREADGDFLEGGGVEYRKDFLDCGSMPLDVKV